MLEFIIFIFLQSHNIITSNGNDLPKIEVFTPASIPQKIKGKIAPKLLENEKTAILAIDAKSGKTLLHKNADRAQHIASLTKIMTALLILENHKLDEVVTVDTEATKTEGSQIDLYGFEQLTVQTLLEAALIPSANDAARALAFFDSGSEAEFVRKMNARARTLNLNSAKFLNVTGLDIWNEKEKTFSGNEMSARDVLTLARIALKNEFFRETVQKTRFYGTSIDENFFHEKKSTNQLLGTFLNLKGVKTGFTNLAGECFVALGEKDDSEILTVILGSPDRFGETKNFLSWIYDSFEWR
jgi:D-alanyl-D-alanine carboxypeptidase